MPLLWPLGFNVVTSIFFLGLQNMNFAAAATEQTGANATEQPGANAPGIATSRLELEWEPGKNAKSYEVLLKPSNPAQKDLRFQVPSPRLEVDVPLDTYQVSIRNVRTDGRRGQWSKAFPVDVKIPKVNLLFPAQNEKILAQKEHKKVVRFQWEPLPDNPTYNLAVWADGEDPLVISTTQTTYALELATKKSYSWSVTTASEMGIDYSGSNQVRHFFIWGQELPSPRIVEIRAGPPGLIRWARVPEAQQYVVTVKKKYIDSDPQDPKDWDVLAQNKIIDGDQIVFPQVLNPSLYSIEVIAQSDRHLPSRPSQRKALLKPRSKLQSLKIIEDDLLRSAIQND